MINTSWIPIEKISDYIQLEPFVFFWITLVLSFIVYKLFFKKISEKRHLNLRTRFYQTFVFLSIASISASIFWFLQINSDDLITNFKLSNFLGLFALILFSISLIKISQIYIYLYLFFMNMSQGVPRLIANLFSVILSFIIFTYLASAIFSVHLTTMLATSAVFSLVLGLALQDTLGNLFSGVAMQIGKPFSIGDWVQVHNGTEKVVGQIQEVTWRATFLVSFSDELIMIPNRMIAQNQILIFSNPQNNVRHSQMFKINFNENLDLVTNILLEEAAAIPEIVNTPAPRVLITETTESWITIKIFYSLNDYSVKYRVGDKIIRNILKSFSKNNIMLATNKINIEK